MTISTKIYVEHSDLGLSDTIQSLEKVNIGVIPDAGTDPEQNVYFFWVEAGDFDAVEAAFEQDETVTDYTMVSEIPERRTYRLTYSDGASLISPLITEMDGLMLDSRNHSDGWVVELQLPDHNTLYRLGERATESGFQFDVLEIHQAEPNEADSEFSLTDSQIEALLCAYEQGYYDEPRETSLEELGSILSISRTAVSGRLKRASNQLIEEKLISTDTERD